MAFRNHPSKSINLNSGILSLLGYYTFAANPAMLSIVHTGCLARLTWPVNLRHRDWSAIIGAMLFADESWRAVQVRRGRNLEVLTIVWNSLEAVIGVIAGLVAGSIAL